MGTAYYVWTSHDCHGQCRRQTRFGAPTQIMGRLDRSYCCWRTAVRKAGAAARYGAQRGSHPVGLEPTHGLPTRFDRDRPAQAHTPTQWQILRIAGRKYGLRANPRSGDAYGDRSKNASPRSEDAVVQGRPDGALSILGSRTYLG